MPPKKIVPQEIKGKEITLNSGCKVALGYGASDEENVGGWFIRLKRPAVPSDKTSHAEPGYLSTEKVVDGEMVTNIALSVEAMDALMGLYLTACEELHGK